MSYLIDTNIISELRRKEANPGVVDWFAVRPANTLYLSVLSLGEIRKGIEALPNSKRKLALRDWLEVDLPAFFTGRILPIDEAVVDRWGRLLARIKRTAPAIDSLIAATALQHGLTLVTRNESDFKFPEVDVINPWR
ncbi:MAG: type II toxin-antitoxin system VapC family toxin [Sulfuritalea sp.]|nr:type II toxin-antitoxin system VapC family toxin [Sulfuritalea sp.]